MAKQKIAVISICSILLLAMVVAVTFNFDNIDDSLSTKSAVGTSTSNKAIKDICRPTDYKKTCENSLSSEAGNTTDPKELIKAAIKVTEKEIRDAMMKSTTIQSAVKDPSTADAFKICQEVLGDAIDDLYRSFEKFDISNIEKWDDYAYDLKIWLSGTVACQETCMDGFQNTEGDTGKKMTQLLKTSRELTVNALAIIEDLSKAYASLTGSKRRLLAVETLPEFSYQSSLCNMFTMFCSNKPEDPFLTRRGLLSDETLSQERIDERRKLHSKKMSQHYNPFNGMFAFLPDKKSSNGMPVDETVYRKRNLLSVEAPAGAPAATPAGAPATPSGSPAAPAGAPATPSGAPSGAPATPSGAPAGAPATPSGAPVGAPATPSGAPATPSGAPTTPSGASAAPAGAPTTAPAGAPVGAPAAPAGAPAAPPDKSQPNAIVAQDGSGNYTTINDALKAVPIRNSKAYVIYVKAGVYKEYVRINNTLTNVVLIGDGPTETKITGNKSVILDALKTYHTATMGVDGFGFSARDIGFENTAGHAGEQAVALRVSSDLAVFHNCHIDGYQDTLYAHVHRQFYRDCTISGTIDFIFGDAAAVFQNCSIVIRKPAANQACMVTANGRKFDYEPTGFVLQNCNITGEPDYLAAAASFKSYLGRPWRDFAKTIVMHSNIDSVIQPKGWEPWPPNLYIDTCWYSEYENSGPAAGLSDRVTWKGIKHVTKEEAESFLPGKFLRGDEWIPATGVPYDSGIITRAA